MVNISVTGNDGEMHEIHGFDDGEKIHYTDNRTSEQKKKDAFVAKAQQAIIEAIRKGKSIRFELNEFSYDGTFGILLETVGEIVGQTIPYIYVNFPELMDWNMYTEYPEEFVKKGTKKLPYAHSDVRVYVTFFKDQRTSTVFDSNTLNDMDVPEVGGES
ncbi:hypothetical protein LASUN_13260 [Lentilactobacillus sunkii]|jgi:hypothetical protein|uniref:Uncharacterized protein n=1 Tax=Lentilactobacillus sunkii TaxID=481719 RepID=A0A1E7XCC4_9LACO|nr:hypothetical protein [Lentilactobacillus sunkii]OFA10776.1 hypothetical protein LASUN_13260 [Lentilactobacillus sunkii]